MKLTKEDQAIIERWKALLDTDDDELDPDDERDWFDVCYGFILGASPTMRPPRAYELAVHIVYRLGLS